MIQRRKSRRNETQSGSRRQTMIRVLRCAKKQERAQESGARGPIIIPFAGTSVRHVFRARPLLDVRLRLPFERSASARTQQYASCTNTGRHRILDRDRTVYDHRLDACRVLVRSRKGGLIPHGTRVEYHDIGECASAQDAAITQSEPLRGHARHLVDRCLQRHEFLHAYILSKNPRESSIRAGMWMTLARL